MFVDERSNNKSSFIKAGPNITFTDNYDKPGSTYGQWNRHEVASSDIIKYQLLICDTSFYKGLLFVVTQLHALSIAMTGVVIC